KFDRKPVRVNSLGTRGPEFQPSKPAQTFRILSLGDSRTFGWGLTEGETYSARLGHLLQEKFGAGKRVEVINAGVNGWAYEQMYVYFRDVGVGYHPDLVIVGEGNGWTQFSEKSSPEFIKKFMWRVRLKNILRRSAIYHYAVELKLNIPLVDPTTNLRKGSESLYLEGDPIHLNVEGNRILAEALFNAVTNVASW